MAFGKKNVISNDLSKYSLILLGQPGIGKSTTISEACAKEFGDDGYLLLNMGKEDGVSAIDGVVYEDVEDWKKFEAIVKDIVKNKSTYYPNLKVVILDTLDQTISSVAEPEAIRRWNTENLGKKDFVPAKTLNGSWGGFGAGMDYVINMILDKMWQLKKVGVNVWMTGHVKTREIVDAVSNQTYTTLSTDMAQKYFNAFKSKVHVVGVACIDRTIETESTGRKNIVTKKDITVNKVKEERRKIVFRDDNYSVDSKSRFAGIVDEIPLNSDALLKALHDAINNSKKESSTSIPTTKPSPATAVVKEPEEVKVESDPLPEEFEEDADIFEEETAEETAAEETKKYPDNLLEVVMDQYKKSNDKLIKGEIRDIAKSYGKFADLPEDELKKAYDMLNLPF